MEMQGLDYINALKYLNQTYSLNLPIKTDTQIKKAESKDSSLDSAFYAPKRCRGRLFKDCEGVNPLAGLLNRKM